jgi:hypothetical protein
MTTIQDIASAISGVGWRCIGEISLCIIAEG